jgi:hypothetical protein
MTKRHKRYYQPRNHIETIAPWVAVVSALAAVGGFAYNSYLTAQADPVQQVAEQPNGFTASDKHIALRSIEEHRRAEIHRDIVAERQRIEALRLEFESLQIPAEPVVSVSIPAMGINNHQVEQYDVTGNITYQNGEAVVTYAPPLFDKLYVATVGVDTTQDGQADIVYGPLGLQKGTLQGRLKLFGHTHSSEPAIMDSFQDTVHSGSSIEATTKSGYTFILTVGTDPQNLDKSNVYAMAQATGSAGDMFSCFLDKSNGYEQPTAEYRLAPLGFAGIVTPDGTRYMLTDIYNQVS